MINIIIKQYFKFYNYFSKKSVESHKVKEWEAHCLIIIMLSTAVLMWGYVLVAFIFIDHYIPWTFGFIATVIHNLSPYLIKFLGNIRLATNTLIGAGMLFQGVSALFSGGFMSPILIWYGILPMLGGIIDGKRGVVTWSILTVSTVCLIILCSFLDLTPGNYISKNGHIIGQSMMVFGGYF